MLDGLEQLKRKVDTLRTKKEQAEGAYKQLLKQIREEFGCKNLHEAEVKLQELQDEELAAAETYSKAKQRFERRHKQALGLAGDE